MVDKKALFTADIVVDVKKDEIVKDRYGLGLCGSLADGNYHVKKVGDYVYFTRIR